MKVIISKIILDAGTQQRPIDDNVVLRYKELYESGVVFPPVKVICEGSKFYCVDGFHRVRMMQLCGKKNIEADIKTGKLQDAIWESFAANKDHGFPRQEGTVRRILERIYQDETWSLKTQKELAEHIGCTQGRVSQIIAELRTPKTEAEPEAEEEPESETEEPGDIEPDEPEDKSDETEAEPTKTKDPVDSVGQTIPADLVEVFAQAREISEYANAIREIRDAITEAAKSEDLLWSRVNVNNVTAKLQKLASEIRLGKPHAVCVYCGGSTNKGKCQNCKGLGWLSKMQWQVVPGELKP